MRKIMSLYVRDWAGDPSLVTEAVTPGAEWVLAGEGVATRKYDGTCCRVLDGVLWKRFDAKRGKTPPPGFAPAQDPNLATGHWPGWVLVGRGPEDRWHREAWSYECAVVGGPLPDGTYELVGPHIQGNPERFPLDSLLPHGRTRLDLPTPLTREGILAYLSDHRMEGIVWHHPDGRMVKIKTRDFGLRWPREGA